MRRSSTLDVHDKWGGVDLVTKGLDLELAPQGVTVDAIERTCIATPGTAERLGGPAFLAWVRQRQTRPARR
jgi:hypothetical protein